MVKPVKSTKKAALKKEYERLYNNLMRRINRLSKQGIYVTWMPKIKKPKRITEASIRKLQKLTNIFNFVSGQKTDDEILPKYAQKLKKKYDIKRQKRMSKEDEERRRRVFGQPEPRKGQKPKKGDDSEQKPRKPPTGVDYDKDFIDWNNILNPPGRAESEALQLYEIATDAIAEALEILNSGKSNSGKPLTSQQRSFYRTVLYRARYSQQRFDYDAEVMILWELLSLYVRKNGFEKASTNLLKFIWTSGQTDYSLFEEVFNALTFEPQDLTEYEKKTVAELKDKLGIT